MKNQLAILFWLLVSACSRQPTQTPQPTLTPTVPATPAPQLLRYNLDSTASNIEYLATGAFNVQLPGTFSLLGGTITLVPESGKYRLKAAVVIDGNSVTAINGIVRDALMINLEVSKYPTARVIADSLELLDLEIDGGFNASQVTLSGTLELHGVTRNITIPVVLEISAGILRALGETRLDLFDYRVNVPTAIMSSTITFKANLHARVAPANQ